MGWHWELGSSPALSRFKSLLLALPLQLFWVVRPAGDWVLPWGIGQICVHVSACQGGIDRSLCLLTPRLSMLIYRLDLSLLVNYIFFPNATFKLSF